MTNILPRSTGIALCLVAFLALPASAADGRRPRIAAAPPARAHVVLVIGDGMSRAAEIAASRYLLGSDDGLAWHGPGFGYQGFAATWDVTTYDRHAEALGLPPYAPGSFLPNAGYDVLRGGTAPWPVSRLGQDPYFLSPLPLRGQGARIPAADSASAATALATGVKTEDGNVAWAPATARGAPCRRWRSAPARGAARRSASSRRSRSRTPRPPRSSRTPPPATPARRSPGRSSRSARRW